MINSFPSTRGILRKNKNQRCTDKKVHFLREILLSVFQNDDCLVSYPYRETKYTKTPLKENQHISINIYILKNGMGIMTLERHQTLIY